MNGHIDIRTLSDYFLNRLSREEETAVQEHLSGCPECRDRLEAMRRLRTGFFEDGAQDLSRGPVFFRILRSGWIKAAAAVIVVAGIGVLTYDTLRNRTNITDEHLIREGHGPKDGEVFAIDTFDAEDYLYYKEKYGDDFLKSDSF